MHQTGAMLSGPNPSGVTFASAAEAVLLWNEIRNCRSPLSIAMACRLGYSASSRSQVDVFKNRVEQIHVILARFRKCRNHPGERIEGRYDSTPD
jgi:hypothetical protein